MSNSTYIYVNIPEYRLKIFEKNKVIKEHKVVVGTPYTPTPIIESAVHKIVANPYWTVPRSIAIREIIPKIKKDSTYLERNGYKVVDNKLKSVNESTIDWNNVNSREFDYWFKQDKGRGNALGLVKFVFPNDYNVYLHDTPSKSKFQYDIRAYSHGCVRVHNPEELADFVLKKFVSNKTNVKYTIKKQRHKIYYLPEELPIHIQYFTCSGDDEGNIYFHVDIYKKDKKAMKELFPGYLPV
ncbi:MAG: L,D-transpeptidase family protein [Bacteroidales bacterium]|nr:L,D-transpeptidase family protein [Bacteroidales bacterium]